MKKIYSVHYRNYGVVKNFHVLAKSAEQAAHDATRKLKADGLWNPEVVMVNKILEVHVAYTK